MHVFRNSLFVFMALACPALVVSQPPASDSHSRFAAPAENLGRLVQSFVDRDEIVGAELLVLHQGRPILHRAFGEMDRDDRRPMQTDSYFAIRSMTKPFTGMAVQLLVDEGKVELDAPVARYLPSFDNERSREITVRQLLEHRSGLPLSVTPGRPLNTVTGGLRELADLAGERGPTHAPGSRFVYSDAGSDALGAMVAAVSGQPLHAFIRERILEPLQLSDIFPEFEAVTASRRSRVPARYTGVAGYWTRYWSATEAPLYPFLKGSGGLVATAPDYAGFLESWRLAMRGRSLPMLSQEAIERALKPASRDALGTGFPDMVADYGQMWMLYRRPASPDEIVAFGHTGSDGTYAYAFPNEELVVCYLTQTRGNETGQRFEAALSHLFLAPDEAEFTALLEPVQARGLEEFTGLYAREGRVDALAAIVDLDGVLMFEFPGRMMLRLRPTDDRDRWIPERMPNDAIQFRRESGRVVGLATIRSGRVDEAVRFRPDASLPVIDELLALRRNAVPEGAWRASLPLRITSTLEQNGAVYPVVEIHDDADRSLTEIDLGGAGRMRVWTNGDRVWRQAPGQAVIELSGLERSDELNGSLRALMGNWREAFDEIIVLSREVFEGEDVYRVRLVPAEGLASTKLVRASDGVVLAEMSLSLIPGAGLLPVEKGYSDFRQEAGLTLPAAQVLRVGGTEIRTRIIGVEARAVLDRNDLTPPQL